MVYAASAINATWPKLGRPAMANWMNSPSDRMV